MKINIEEKIGIAEDVQVKIEDGLVYAKGPKGEVSRKFLHPKINIAVKENKIIISSKKATKREKKMIGTFKAHIKNMLKGVIDPFVYKLKVCSSHFPMTASVKDNKFSVQNFLGENIPRTVKLLPGVNVKVEGSEITVESADKELAGQIASSIEQLCKITNRDRRIFQDGIYLISKAGKEIK